jgi:hypothetical protein
MKMRLHLKQILMGEEAENAVLPRPAIQVPKAFRRPAFGASAVGSPLSPPVFGVLHSSSPRRTLIPRFANRIATFSREIPSRSAIAHGSTPSRKR